jgi:cyclic pyranopterin phosphate synthase
LSPLTILQPSTRLPLPPPGVLPRPRAHDEAERNTRLIDAFGRRLTYLRVSVTDRCNLRCTYCLPEDADFPFGDRDFLSPAEIETLVGALVRLGIRRVRLTGGEPLVRKDILEIVRRVKGLGVDDLSLTTNGTELARLALPLREAGLDRVNVSVDSLDPERFHALTRRGHLQQVWDGIEAALAAGLEPVKLNAVLLTEDGESGNTDVEDLAALTLDRPFSVRFIERMPTGVNQELQEEQFLSADDARARIEARFGPLLPLDPAGLAPRTGPATALRLAGARGTIGFITPLSHTFCADCNRLRLTSRGELRLCLFADRTYPLRPLLEVAPGDPAHRETAIQAEILRVLQEKPAEHMLTQGNFGNLASFMQIGG